MRMHGASGGVRRRAGFRPPFWWAVGGGVREGERERVGLKPDLRVLSMQQAPFLPLMQPHDAWMQI